MEAIRIEALEQKEIVKGFHARFIHSEHVTLAYWEVNAGATLPAHHHFHEQIVNVLEGELELVVEGKTMRLTSGHVVILPSNVEHSGQAITNCRILDVFSPIREDYR